MPLTHGNEIRAPEREGGARLGVVHARYDFALDGGAVSTIGLDTFVPDGAIIFGGMLKVLTAMVSTGGLGTIAINVEGAGDILAAVDADTLSGEVDIIPDGTGSTAVAVTAEQEVEVTIAVAALTAGKFDVYLLYVAPGVAAA